MDSRSSLEEIANVSYALKYFTLNELFYVLHKNSTLSLFDVNRTKKIADSVYHRYAGNHTFEQVDMVIKLLGNLYSQTLPMQTEVSFFSIVHRDILGPSVLPFSSVCFACKRSLGKFDANQRSIKVYCANGSVVSGMK